MLLLALLACTTPTPDTGQTDTAETWDTGSTDTGTPPLDCDALPPPPTSYVRVDGSWTMEDFTFDEG